MEKFTKLITTVDKILHSLFIAFLVVSIVMAGFGVLGFFIDTKYIGEVDTFVTLGVVELEVTDEVLNSNSVDMFLIATSFLSAIGFALICVLMKLIQNIIAPMKEGKPFGQTVCDGLKKLAIFVLCSGIVVDILDFIGTLLIYKVYNIEALFNTETVIAHSIAYTSDGEYIIFAAVLYLFSYIFKYGAELQTQVDETL